jgi:hypothetical protein
VSNARRGSSTAPVRRRHVLFFGGFDPKGASWYHGMYRRHAARQATVNGLALEVGPRARDAGGNQHWIVRARDAAGTLTESRIEVVGWDAIVRGNWPRSSLRVLGEMLAAYARLLWYTPRGVCKTARIAPRTLFALCYPLLFFVAGALLVLLLASLAGLALGALGLHPVLAWGGFAVVVAAGARGLLRLERRLDTSLLARIFAFVSRYAVHGLPELDAVLAHGARRIAEAAHDPDCDEVLVVGYSVGTILATRALAQALARLEGARPAIALLTLGHCIPMLGFFPQAGSYLEELARLAASDAFDWIDVSSPADWASFPLLDPLEVCEVTLARRGRGAPRMHSPRFHTLFAREAYQRMIRNKHTMHTMYLMATGKPGRYDYFAITAGAEPLATRYPPARGERA